VGPTDRAQPSIRRAGYNLEQGLRKVDFRLTKTNWSDVPISCFSEVKFLNYACYQDAGPGWMSDKKS